MVKWKEVIKILVKNAANRNMIEFVSLEEIVPQDHLLRRTLEEVKTNLAYRCSLDSR